MKILKLHKIDNFGIFKNFDWDLSLANPTNQNPNQTYDFKDINIFYGRNYSGKTSLSKIIRALETKTISPKYQAPNFKILLADNSVVTHSSLTTFTHPIYVYNSDFVKENLKFIHDDTQNVESFSVTLGGDNQQILDRIQELKDELGSEIENAETGIYLSIKNKKGELSIAQLNFNNKDKELQNLLKNKASGQEGSIRTQHNKFGDSNYNITKLAREIESVCKPIYQPLTEDAKASHDKLILQIKMDDPPTIPQFDIDFESLIKAVEEILNSQVGQSNKIDELVQNGLLNKWVEGGLTHHKDRTTCAFCSNTIPSERLKALRQHFDEESQKLKSRINKGIELLNSKKSLLKVNIDTNYFYNSFHVELNRFKSELANLLEMQENSFNTLILCLENKKDKLFSVVDFTSPINYFNDINRALDSIGNIREKHIELTNKLKENQDNAKNELRLDHIYHFLQDINYNNLTAEISVLNQAIKPCQNELNTLEIKKIEIITNIKTEEDKLKSESEACTRINNILKHDFGHQALHLEAIEANEHSGKTIKFEIQRNGTKAHNLSEGECSLISFCYFLAKIQDSLETDKKPIIWIDDPISSLDSNHIFFIFSLIEQKICQERKYEQLFISTHNLDFLKYLRRIKGVESDNSISTVKEQNRKASYFLIQRNDSISTIKQMPIYLSKFLTEFNFLFDQIYKCATVTHIDDTNFSLFYNFGNNARKFLEIYTFYKFPSPKYSLDDQLKVFWGEEIHKTLTDRIHNEYSHMTGILERGSLITDQPEMQKSAIAIIKKVQEDRVQYNALLESINIAITDDPLHPENLIE
ncbi:AAA family ATPase [Acinetobacter bereziniae]|uniref:AAA family ATPase n=1 Tax=Acinetobacter bereziniae TaxID=106648 RepID=UPI0019016231|nr:AAA family ATPase [Acinetobacter bereziniae]MBJ8444169.1 AAA family ATPase [Acinetobacter bereziniae]